MKKYFIIAILLLCYVGLNQAQVSGKYDGITLVRNNSLCERGDSLHISFDLWVSRQSVADFVAVRLVPKILEGHNVIVLPDIMVLGKNKRKTYNRWLKLMSKKNRASYLPPKTLLYADSKSDEIIHFNYMISYEMWMDNATLAFEQEIIGYNDKRSLNVFVLGGRVQTQGHTPYVVQSKVNFTEPAAEQKEHKRQGQAFLDFQVAKSDIRPDYRRNPQELAKIQSTFNEIRNNTDMQITGLFIEGYASPEGKTQMNQKLSEERSYALKNYIQANFNTLLQEEYVKVSGVGEDWEGLCRELELGNMPFKEAIIGIIKDNDNVEVRKQKIMNHNGGRTYKTMLSDIYPLLRRVEYQINFNVKDYSTLDVRSLIDKKNEMLSHLELYRTAMEYSRDSERFFNIMVNIIPLQFKNDPIANINAAAVMLERDEVVSARRILEKYKDNPAAWNNMGVAELKSGNIDAAEIWFRKVSGKGKAESDHNLKEAERKRLDDLKQERRYR